MIPLSLAAVGLFLAAAMTDLTRRRIPNGLVLALALLGLARIATSPGGALPDLGAAFAVLLAGALIFELGFIGGGDVKLLAAGALWLGSQQTPAFLMTTALIGGLLGLAFLLFSRSKSLPYGVAIAGSGLLSTWLITTTGH